MADRVIQRHDTAARWEQFNPVLASGEIGIITDGARGYKIGDGKTPWNSLPFPANPTNVVQETGDSESVVMSQKATTEKITELASEFKSIINGVALTMPTEVTADYLSADGSWNGVSNLYHVVVDVSQFRGEKISASSSGDLIQYGFLKTYNTSTKCEWSSYIGRTDGKPQDVTIPNDANYLYLYTAGSKVIPSISGIKDKEGLVEEVNDIYNRIYNNRNKGNVIIGDGYLDGAGNWEKNSSLHHVVCDISNLQGEKVTTTSVVQYGFLKTYNTNTKCEWVGMGRMNGTPTDVLIPKGANYLYLYIGGTISVPTINISGEYVSIIGSINALNDAVSAQGGMYVSKSDKLLSVYIGTKGKFVKYPLEYRQKEFISDAYPCYYDNWGLGRLSQCNFDGANMTEERLLFNSSEAEIAIGTGPNFSGGSAHGFENIVNGENGREILFLIDGIKVGENSSFELRSAKTVEIVQKTTLYKAYSESQEVGKILKKWEFNEKGCNLSVNLTFTNKVDYGIGYIGMMGVYRHLDGNEGSGYLTNLAIKNNNPFNSYYVQDNWESQESNEGLRNPDKQCNEIILFSDYGLSFKLSVNQSTYDSEDCGMFVATNNNPYNKIYNKVTEGGKATIGKVISAKVSMNVL